MSVVRTNAAAAMLGVSPNTLRSWARRFGYPKPRRTQGGHRQYELAEIEALREAFAETHNVSSAISLARERGEGPSTAARVEAALGRFDEVKTVGCWRRAWPCGRSSARWRSCCSPRWSASPEMRTLPRRSTSSPGARPPAGWRRRCASLRPRTALKERWCSRPAIPTTPTHCTPRRWNWCCACAAAHAHACRHARPVAARPGAPGAVPRRGHPHRPPGFDGRLGAARLRGPLRRAARVGVRYRGALPDTGTSTVGRLGETPLVARDKLLATLTAVDHNGGSDSQAATSRAPAVRRA